MFPVISSIRTRLPHGAGVLADQVFSSLGNVLFAVIVSSGGSAREISNDAIRFVLYQAALGVNRYVLIDPALARGMVLPNSPFSRSVGLRCALVALVVGSIGGPLVYSSSAAVLGFGGILGVLAVQEALRFWFLSDARLVPVVVYQGSWVAVTLVLALATSFGGFACWAVGGVVSLGLGLVVRARSGFSGGDPCPLAWRNLPEFLTTSGYVVVLWTLVKVLGNDRLSAELRVGQTVLGGSGVLLLVFTNILSVKSAVIAVGPWVMRRRQILQGASLCFTVIGVTGLAICALPVGWIAHYFPLWRQARIGTAFLATFQAVSAFDVAASITSRSLGRSMRTSRLRLLWVLGSFPFFVLALRSGHLAVFAVALAIAYAILGALIWHSLWNFSSTPKLA
jgi:hypothetical protein